GFSMDGRRVLVWPETNLETPIDVHFEDKGALASPAFRFNKKDDRDRSQEYGHSDPKECCVLMLSHARPRSFSRRPLLQHPSSLPDHQPRPWSLCVRISVFFALCLMLYQAITIRC